MNAHAPQHDRQLPFSIDVEQAAIGVLLMHPSSHESAFRLLKPEHFYDPLHQRIFATMARMSEAGDCITPITMNASMAGDAGLAELPASNYFENLARSAPVLPVVKGYARLLADLARRRATIVACQNILDKAYATPGEGAEQIIEAEQSFAALRSKWGARESLVVANVAGWGEQPVPEQKWCDVNRIPARAATLFSGNGGEGKTTLAMQLMVAGVLQKPWMDTIPQAGPTLGVFCEDDPDEMNRRFSAIARHYDVSMKRLSDAGLHPISLFGQEAVLGATEGDGIIRPTKLYFELCAMARDIRPAVIVIDNSADVFAGNENDRAQVRQFVGLLSRLALIANSDPAIVLTSHPSLTGIGNGTGTSGSTAWNASVRARLYLRKPKPEGDEQTDPDERILEVMKSNYGPAGETITLRWSGGLFLPTHSDRVHWIDKHAAERGADDLFLGLVDKFDKQGRNVSSVQTAPTYAPTQFAKDPDAIGKRIPKRALAAAMNRLFAADRIHVATYGRPSRPYSKIALGPHP